jgi:PhnB protein
LTKDIVTKLTFGSTNADSGCLKFNLGIQLIKIIIMKTKVQPIPAGYNSITPYLSVKNAVKAIEFYKKAFGAKEVGRILMPDGTVAHAELEIGSSRIMLAEENEQWGNRSPVSIGGSPITICLYVENVDAVFERALKEGAKVKGDMVVKDQFHGDRSGNLTDPFGHEWSVMTHIEDLTFEELQSRTDAMFAEIKKTQ